MRACLLARKAGALFAQIPGFIPRSSGPQEYIVIWPCFILNRTIWGRGAGRVKLTGTVQCHPHLSHLFVSTEVWIPTKRSHLSRRTDFYWVATFSLPCIFGAAVHIYISPGLPWAACQLNELVINVDTWLCAYRIHRAVTERLLRPHWQRTCTMNGHKAPLTLQSDVLQVCANKERSRNWLGRTLSHIDMHSAFPAQLFDYFVDAVIVRPPLISSIYSPAMPEGHLGKFLQTLSIYQDGRQTWFES